MKTKTYTVYTFAELSGPARQRAIEEHAQFIAEQFDGDATKEDAVQCLAFAGFDISEVLYSGFSCQGDGACFEGEWNAASVNPAGMREHAPLDAELHGIADRMAAIAKAFPGASFTVKHRGHYLHEYCTEFDVEFADPDLSDAGPYAAADDTPQMRQDRWQDDSDAAEKAMIETARDAMRWIYRQLEKEYDYQTGEAQVIESIEANGYEFTADGRID